MNFAEILAQFSYKPKCWSYHNREHPFLVLDAAAISRMARVDRLGGFISLTSHPSLIAKQGNGYTELSAFQIASISDAMLPTYASPEFYYSAYALPKKLCIPEVRSKDIDEVLQAVIKIFPELGLLWYVERVERSRVMIDRPTPMNTTVEVRPVAPVKHCVACDGTGRYEDGPFGICPACAGTGDISPGVWAQLHNLWSFYLHDRMDVVNSTLGGVNAYSV